MRFDLAKLSLCLPLIASGLAGCNVYQNYGYGKIAASRLGDQATKIELPAQAPSISQRYMPLWGPQDSKSAGRTVGSEHKGFDLLLRMWTPVLAAADGQVVANELSFMFGRRLAVNHDLSDQGFPLQTRYFHLSKALVAPGDRVTRGQLIAYSGASGLASGGLPHLHFEVHRLADVDDAIAQQVVDPQLFWVDGPGQITCFDISRNYPNQPVKLTYPAPCRDLAWQ
ncbi:MAG: M23 family metallopeptidase [Pseudomonadota bacterium]